MRRSRRFVLNFPSGFADGDFTYTGTYTWVDDGSLGWRLKFLTSGTFTPLKRIVVDMFLVGGGGGGRNAGNNAYPGAGGGGGYTATVLNVVLTSGTAYTVTIGAGGAANLAGGTTSFNPLGYSIGGGTPDATYYYFGGDGGSGGGGGVAGGGNGGSDGSDGTISPRQGFGQGTTTREFGEVTGDLYAGGGGSGGGKFSYSANYGLGGDGGGGNGGTREGGNGVAGTTNTGGGGGGGGTDDDTTVGSGAAGGSGIIVIRNKR